MERKKNLAKGQVVTANYGVNKGERGVVISSYMQNKYAYYMIRMDNENIGIMHGQTDQFTVIEKEKKAKVACA